LQLPFSWLLSGLVVTPCWIVSCFSVSPNHGFISNNHPQAIALFAEMEYLNILCSIFHEAKVHLTAVAKAYEQEIDSYII
jgi:hypothetical protein